MTREQLQALIDRVIGKKGILRAPAWWVRRLFNAVIGYAEDLTNKKPDIYILQAGEYAVDSETGKKLLEIINNPDKYILQRRVSDTTGETLIRYYAGTMNIISDSHIYLTTPARITHTYISNDRVAALEFTHSIGMIGKAENAISVGFSDIPEKASFGIGVDDEMSDVSEYTVSNKVIKAYVDGKVGNINTILDSINGEEI